MSDFEQVLSEHYGGCDPEDRNVATLLCELFLWSRHHRFDMTKAFDLAFIDFEFDTERLPLAFWASAVYSLHPPDDFAPQQPLDEGLISQGVRRMDHVINETGLPVHESIVNLLRSCVDHVGLDAFLEHARAADTAMFNRLAAESGKPGGMINSNEFYTLDDLTQSFGQGDDVSGLKYAKKCFRENGVDPPEDKTLTGKQVMDWIEAHDESDPMN